MSAVSQLHQAATLIRSAEKIVVLTGAGISTASGIPDYRSQNTGFWQHLNPMEIASADAFRSHPERFYHAWLRPIATYCLNAQPNPAHLALTRLEQASKLAAIITQNIDLLHSRAGSSNVIELHGSLANFHCPHCTKTFPGAPFYQQLLENESIPHCPHCQTILKPNIVLFGDNLSKTSWLSATKYAQECDLMMVIGSSLNVAPANMLPYFAIEMGTPLIILTHSPTPLDEQATLVLNEDIATALPLLITIALEEV
jgi:NAD-dependent deacetylase